MASDAHAHNCKNHMALHEESVNKNKMSHHPPVAELPSSIIQAIYLAVVEAVTNAMNRSPGPQSDTQRRRPER